MPAEEIIHSSPGLLQVKARVFPEEGLLYELESWSGVRKVTTLGPVLPIQSRKDLKVPFLNARELLARVTGTGAHLWEAALEYESERGGISPEEVMGRMDSLVTLLEDAIRQGMEGTVYRDRILGPQAGGFRERWEAGDLLDAGLLNRMILYVTALMEVKSSMGVIVAAPTAGACGAFPGICIGAAHGLGLPREELTKAMLAGGLVGVFIAAGSTFAAEVCGCQAETGAGAGMAAAALATLRGGSTEVALNAASMALQNTLGMICDPVANRVEVPCLGRNVLAAGNALASANMALAGFDPVIPLDEVIQTMDDVGKSLPRELRCTALGGLSVTETSRRIQKELEGPT
jgi:L-serine dehydratase